MVDVAQLVRVPDCGSEGREFESHLPPQQKKRFRTSFFCFNFNQKQFLNRYVEIAQGLVERCFQVG